MVRSMPGLARGVGVALSWLVGCGDVRAMARWPCEGPSAQVVWQSVVVGPEALE